MTTIMIASTPDDIPKKYGHFYLMRFARIARRVGHKVIFLETATPENLMRVLERYDPHFFIFNGHGGDRAVVVMGRTVLIAGPPSYSRELNIKVLDENVDLFKGKLVYLFTCHAGVLLAPRLIEAGAKAVAGYTDAFLWVADDFSPSRDLTASPFFVAGLTLPIELLNGRTWGEASEALRRKFLEYLELAMGRDDFSARYFYHNLTNFISLGDMNCRLQF